MKRALVLLALAACTKKDPPAPAPSTPDAEVVTIAAVDAGPITAIVPSASASIAVAPLTPAQLVKDASPPTDPESSPLAHVGKITVWTMPDGDFSLVVAADGASPATIIRRTSGEVTDVQAVALPSGEIAIGWVSSLVSGQGQVSALAFASADLKKVSPPTTLALLGKTTDHGHLALAPNPRGGVIAAHEGPGVRCMFMDHASECLTFEAKAVGLDGKVDKLGTRQLDGGPSPELWIVPLEDRGAIVYGSSMRGGRTFATLDVPWASTDKAPELKAPVCGGLALSSPDFLRGANGEIVCMNMASETTLIAAITAKDGTVIAPADTKVTKVECVNHQTKVSFAGGDVVLARASPITNERLKKKCE